MGGFGGDGNVRVWLEIGASNLMSVIIDADITHIRDMNEGVVSSIKLAKYTGKGDPISTGISDPIRRAQANQRPISIPMMAIYTILDFSLAEISRSYKGNSTY